MVDDGVGVGVADADSVVEVAVGVASWLGLVVPVGCSVGVAVCVAEWLAVGVLVPALLGCVDVEVGVEIVVVGIFGAVDDPEPVHAETVAETRIVKAAQLTMVSLTPPAVAGVVLRTFIKPPLCPASNGVVSRSRHLASGSASEVIRAANRVSTRAD